MRYANSLYIDGAWQEPAAPRWLSVIDPATEEPFAEIALGGSQDVDRAVAAARRAFPAFAATSREERIGYLRRLSEGFGRRKDELARTITREMGAPLPLPSALRLRAARATWPK
jgi:aldehyde dehydrogenase (NAD+)